MYITKPVQKLLEPFLRADGTIFLAQSKVDHIWPQRILAQGEAAGSAHAPNAGGDRLLLGRYVSHAATSDGLGFRWFPKSPVF